MKNDKRKAASTDTTTPWTLGELCDYWRANLARLRDAMDFRTLAAIQEVFSANMHALKVSQSDNLWMPANRAQEKAAVLVPSWIPKPEGKRGLPHHFRQLAAEFRVDILSNGDAIADQCEAIAAEFESSTTVKPPFGSSKGPLAAGRKGKARR